MASAPVVSETTGSLPVMLSAMKDGHGVWPEPLRSSFGRYNRTVMSIQVAYRDGVFKPLEEVAGTEPGAIYTAFSKEELRDFIETVGWLKAAEKSFEFWDNPSDAVYDTL